MSYDGVLFPPRQPRRRCECQPPTLHVLADAGSVYVCPHGLGWRAEHVHGTMVPPWRRMYGVSAWSARRRVRKVARRP